MFPTVINGGTDYIERNAMVLVTLLEKLNSCKTGNHPIKVVGFSMGGVVARYALRYMEEQNINHNVDLFVSIDSPHQGAVIPKGIQDVADLLNDLTLGISDGPLDLLESPAAKQLLKHHISSNSVSPAGAPDFHDRIFTELNQMGYPQNSRNISVINGPLDGSPKNDFGQQFVDARAKAILGTLRADLKLNYSPLPGNTINDLYSRIYLRFPLLKITIFKRERPVSSLSSLESLENSPGGYYDVEKLVDDFFERDFFIFTNNRASVLQDFIRDVFLNINVAITDANFSFIPTKSGLDFIGDPYLYEELNTRHLTCTGETPFDSYFAPQLSQKHIFIGSQAADFIKDEINGIEREPPVEPSLENLSGPFIICAQSSYVFDACSGSISSWSVSSNLVIESSTEYSIIVRPQYSTSRGSGYITATSISGSSVTKEVYVGKPGVPSFLLGPSTVTTGAVVNYQGGISEGATTYEWRLPYPFTTVSTFDYWSQDWQLEAPGNRRYAKAFTGYAKTNGYVQVMGVNACGTGGAKLMYVSHGTGGGGSITSIDETSDDVNEVDISPNPALNRASVRLAKLTEYEGEPPTRILGIKVLDQNSRERKFYRYNEPITEVEINVAFLTRGLNFLIIITDQGPFTKKLLIE